MKTRSKSIFNIFTFFALLASLISSAVFVTPAYAAGIVVNSNIDIVANDGTCTLREAIINANGDSQLFVTAGECAAGIGTDTITFAANYTITLGSQLSAVTTTININGHGAANTIVEASTCNPITLLGGCTPASYRVFQVSNTGNLSLDDLTVRHGDCNSSCDRDSITFTGYDEGGGIYNTGTLKATNIVFSGNSAISGGAISNYVGGTLIVANSTFSGNTVTNHGGGIINDSYHGTITLTNSTFSNNLARYGGGGIYNRSGDTFTVTNSTFSGNSAGDGIGGGIYNNSTLKITNSIFSNNSTDYGDGGGIYNDSYHGILTLSDSTFLSNTAAGTGGGVYNGGNLTVTNSILSDNSSTNGGGIYNTGPISITNSTFSENATTGYGGGLYNQSRLTLTNSTFSGNSATFHGGGIYNNYHNNNPTIVTNSTFSGNSAVGGLYGDGGGLYNGSSTTVMNSTFSGNSTTRARGGGIFNDAPLALTNSTLSGNSASTSGGGIYNTSIGTLTVTNSTLSGNSAGTGNSTNIGGGGIYNTGLSILKNTIVANSASRDCKGAIIADTYNLATDNTCGNATQKTSVEINLGSLADNGGPTQTHALLTGSQAIDAGDNTVCAIAPVNNLDQRNMKRPDGTSCDVGAFELMINPTVMSIMRTSANPSNSASLSFTVTFSESVTGVEASDFSLATTGVSGATVSGVSGTGTTYTVTVNTGTGNGTIRLDVLDDDTIVDVALNPLGAGFTSGETYDIEKTAPTVISSLRVSPSPANLASVDFTVTFSESVTGVDTSDFNLITTGISSAAVSGVIGSGSTYNVTVNTGSGNGTIRLDVANDGSIKDAVLNPLGAGFTNGEIYTIIKSATFNDVPLDYWASNFIERLYNAGITGGCSVTPLNYCPDSTVTRAQMAVFLLKGMHGSSYTPPAVGASTGFSDVATDYWAAAWIKQLAAEGITGGCGTGIYCPDATVTRAQMAIFLLKAKHGSSYSPPAATGVFTDVPIGYWADKWIEQLAVEGITGGCGVGVYCPDNSVTRAQMAVFLVKAFNLP